MSDTGVVTKELSSERVCKPLCPEIKDVPGGEFLEKPQKERKPKARNSKHIELGKKGERAAAAFLDRRGYEILERNYVCFAGEADIIAMDGEVLVFVEVKTRKDNQRGFPSEAVTKNKREKYEMIALENLNGTMLKMRTIF